MKTIVRLSLLGCMIGIWLSGCSSSSKPRRETFVPLPKAVVDHVGQATYEVVVAKETNTSIIFDQDPLENAPFQKKGDAYVSIGNAFLIGPNRFVSAAHVMQVDTPSLFSVLKLRDIDGKVFTPTVVTRFSDFRYLIEFQVDQPDETRTPLTLANGYQPGQTVFEVGNIDGDGLSYRSAPSLQSIPEPTEGKWKYIRFSSNTAGGAHGGPLVNEQGEVVGVLVRKGEKDQIGYGVPIGELSSLPKNHAEFYRKKVQFHALPKPVDKDWIFSPSLPKNIEQLISEARASLAQLIQGTYADIASDKDARYFPRQKGFRSYLRTQDIGSDLGWISSDPYGSRWKIHDAKLDRDKDVKPDQQLKDYAQRGFIPVLVSVPSESNIGDFNRDAEKVARTMISSNSLGALSKKGMSSLLMSVGKPDELKNLTDHLGRYWQIARWFYHDANFALSTLCTPVPTGSICLVSIGSYGQIALEEDLVPHFLDQTMISYRGSLKQWTDFLSALDPKMMPQALKEVQVEFTAGKSVDVRTDRFSYHYPSSKLDADTKLILKMGYDPNQELGSVILMVELYPGNADQDWFSTETRYPPTDDASESWRTNWKNLTQKTGPFSGVPELRKKNEYKRIMKMIAGYPKTSDQIESALVAICQRPAKLAESDLTQTCADFIQSLKPNSN